MYSLRVSDTFSAAHSLPGYPGKCVNLHGHNYRVTITVTADKLDDAGMVMDFAELKQWMGEVLERLDHKHLNDLPEFSGMAPTAEAIARWIFDQLDPSFKCGRVCLSAVAVSESDSSTAEYHGE